MKSRIFIISSYIFTLIACTSCLLLAQQDISQGPYGSGSFYSPYSSTPFLPQGTTTSSLPYGSLSALQSPSVPPTATKGLQDLIKQQQRTQIETAPPPSLPSELEPLSSIESTYQKQILTLIPLEKKIRFLIPQEQSQIRTVIPGPTIPGLTFEQKKTVTPTPEEQKQLFIPTPVFIPTPEEQKQLLTLTLAEQNQLQTLALAEQRLLLTLAPADRSMILGGLRQFGYSLFNGNVTTFAPVDDVPVGPSYILGPGDILRINTWGAMETTYIATVDRNGKIYLPTIGPVRVWGLSFSQAEKLIQQYLSQYYKGFQTSITMENLRTIKVYVVGEIKQPGAYTVSALSTITNVLFASGGPKKSGSLRNIVLKRNHHTVGTLDLYDLLLRGDKTNDFRLESGDVIFVPTIGNVVGIVGEIIRPAIYELKEPIRIRKFINTISGGTTPQSYLKHVQIVRPKPNAEQKFIDLDFTKVIGGNGDTQCDTELQNGDLVRVYPTDNRIYNTISIAGAVKYPGDYEIKTEMRLSQILPPEALLPEAYLDGLEITRYGGDLTTVAEILHLNLKKAWDGDPIHDILLMPYDQIAVRSAAKASESVILEGEFKLPGTYNFKRGEFLSSVIKRAHGFTERAYLKGAILLRMSVAKRERTQLVEFIRQLEESTLSETKSGVLGFTPETARLREIEATTKKNLSLVIASKVTLGRIIIRLDAMEKFEGSPDDILLEDGDKLIIPQKPSDVMIVGSVRNPTAIVHQKGENIEYYINRGGGFAKVADKKEIYLLKVDGSAIVGFLKLRDIDPGDAIVVPPKVKLRDLSWLAQLTSMVGNTALTLGSLAAITR